MVSVAPPVSCPGCKASPCRRRHRIVSFTLSAPARVITAPQPLLIEMSDWISKTRLQSAYLFRTMIVYFEEHLTVEVHKLIPHIQRALHLATSAKVRTLGKPCRKCARENTGIYMLGQCKTCLFKSVTPKRSINLRACCTGYPPRERHPGML